MVDMKNILKVMFKRTVQILLVTVVAVGFVGIMSKLISERVEIQKKINEIPRHLRPDPADRLPF